MTGGDRRNGAAALRCMALMAVVRGSLGVGEFNCPCTVLLMVSAPFKMNQVSYVLIFDS